MKANENELRETVLFFFNSKDFTRKGCNKQRVHIMYIRTFQLHRPRFAPIALSALKLAFA